MGEGTPNRADALNTHQTKDGKLSSKGESRGNRVKNLLMNVILSSFCIEKLLVWLWLTLFNGEDNNQET